MIHALNFAGKYQRVGDLFARQGDGDVPQRMQGADDPADAEPDAVLRESRNREGSERDR